MDGRPARQMNNFGSALHKIGASFLLPEAVARRLDAMTLEVEAGAKDPYQLEAWRIDADLRARLLGVMSGAAGEWSEFRASMSSGGAPTMTANTIAAQVR